MKLKLVEHGAIFIEQLVAESQIDVGLIVLSVDQSIFNIYPFINDEFLLYIHHDHPLAKRESVCLSELKDEQFINFSKDFAIHDYINSACKEAGFNPSISYVNLQWDLIVELVASKLGVTLLPASIFGKQNNPGIKTIPLQKPSLQWKLGIVTKKDAYYSFALRNFLQLFTKDYHLSK